MILMLLFSLTGLDSTSTAANAGAHVLCVGCLQRGDPCPEKPQRYDLKTLNLINHKPLKPQSSRVQGLGTNL